MTRPSVPVSMLTANRASAMAPHTSIGGRLFQTSAMLVPIAVKASTFSFSSIGIEKAPMAKEKAANRSEEHTSELQTLMRKSYAVFCLKKKKYKYMNVIHII